MRHAVSRPPLLALALLVASPLALQAKSAEKPEAHNEIALSAKQAEGSGVEQAVAGAGPIAEEISAPGVVTPDQDRIARVPAKVVGAVAEMRKRLGDEVTEGEIVAVLDSREVADAKSELLGALVNDELQQTLYERAATLWNKRVATEQAYLQAKATAAGSELRVKLARHKLAALGVGNAEIDALKPSAPTGQMGRYPIHAPIAGRVIERKVDIGASVGGNNDPSELYTIADLSRVWVDLSIPASELGAIHEGQTASIQVGTDRTLTGKIIFIGPLINQDTRSARVLAAFDNPDMALRPGGYVSATVTLKQTPAAIRVPRAAVQTVEGKSSVFVRTEKGFAVRQVTLGRANSEYVEVQDGLAAGETVASSNTFIIKAELGKSEAAHDD